MDEDPLKRTRWPAMLAFLLAVTALLLPWWGLSYADGQTTDRTVVRAFQPVPDLTTSWGPWVSGLLVVAAALLLFVRLAAHSQKHEPAMWRRDLWIATALILGAVVVCTLWPQAVPSFWGGRTYVPQNGTGPNVTETEMPMIAWWMALIAGALTGLAAFWSKPTTDK